MRELDGESARMLRELFLAKIRLFGWGFSSSGAVMAAFDGAVQQFNKMAATPRVTRKCHRCGRRSVRGRYEDGKRRWYCPDCN